MEDMENMKDFVDIRLGVSTPKTPNVPVSFRCSQETVVELDLLAKYLGFSTRSKLLSELVPIAINDAVANLPSDILKDYYKERDQILHDLFEEHAISET